MFSPCNARDVLRSESHEKFWNVYFDEARKDLDLARYEMEMSYVDEFAQEESDLEEQLFLDFSLEL